MDCPAALVTVAVATPVQVVGIFARTSQLLLATASSGAVGPGSTVRDGSVAVSSVHAVSPNAANASTPSTSERLLIGPPQCLRAGAPRWRNSQMQLNHPGAEAPDVVSEDTDACTGEW